MKIAIVSSLDNGVGLERDYRLMRRLCESAGHEVTGLHFRKDRPAGRYDLCIFGEVFDRRFLPMARRHWIVPNPEWWFDAWNPYIRRMDRVLCKTRDTERIFAARGARTSFVGFASDDRMDATVTRERRFLHIAGESMLKGTQAIVDAWERYAIQYPLTVIANKMDVRPVPGVTVLKRIDEADVRRLQNACLFHLQPSEYEGFGHVLHESLSVGAVLATTDSAPMNEVRGAAALIAPATFRKHGLARTAQVDAAGVMGAVEYMAGMRADAIDAARALARGSFEAEVREFEAAFLREVAA